MRPSRMQYRHIHLGECPINSTTISVRHFCAPELELFEDGIDAERRAGRVPIHRTLISSGRPTKASRGKEKQPAPKPQRVSPRRLHLREQDGDVCRDGVLLDDGRAVANIEEGACTIWFLRQRRWRREKIRGGSSTWRRADAGMSCVGTI